MQGTPVLVRTDCGTENGILAVMQCHFRQYGDDNLAGDKSHKYGTSPANQRIESCGLSSEEEEQVGGLVFSKI